MVPFYFWNEPKASLQKSMGPFIKEQHEFAQCFFGTTIRFRVGGGEINDSVQREKQGWFNPSAKNNEKSTPSAKKMRKLMNWPVCSIFEITFAHSSL